MAFINENPTHDDIVRLSVDNEEIINNEKIQYLNLLLVNLSKKDL